MRKKYIDEFYETKDSDFYAHAKETLFLKSIQKQAKNKKFKILDIGCGSGELVIQMARLGYNIHAIDDAKNSIEYTEKRLKKEKIKGVKLKNVSLLKFNPKEKFDIITLQDVLEHIKDDDKSLEKIKNMIKPKGILIISVPALMFLWGRHDEFNEHQRRYNKKELKNKLEKYFKIKSIRYWGFLSIIPALFMSKLFYKKYDFDSTKSNTILYRLLRIWFEKIEGNFWVPIGTCVFAVAEKK